MAENAGQENDRQQHRMNVLWVRGIYSYLQRETTLQLCEKLKGPRCAILSINPVRRQCHRRLRGSACVSFTAGFWNGDSRWLLISLCSSSCQAPNKNRPQRCVSGESRRAENRALSSAYHCCLLVKFAQRLLMTANTWKV